MLCWSFFSPLFYQLSCHLTFSAHFLLSTPPSPYNTDRGDDFRLGLSGKFYDRIKGLHAPLPASFALLLCCSLYTLSKADTCLCLPFVYRPALCGMSGFPLL